MNPEAMTQKYVRVGAVVLLLGVAVTASILLLRPIRLHDDLSGPINEERLPWPDMRLNLNSATAAELTVLPGIGETYAQRIVELRMARGGQLRSLDELREISGIGDARLESIAPYVVIAPP